MEKITKNILFITLVKIESINERGIYTDLMKEFLVQGYNVTIISPFERRERKKTLFQKIENIQYLNVRTLNIQKTNIFEKGIATLLVEYQFLRALKKYTNNSRFDLVVYTTPPITFINIIKYIKKRDHAKSYLLLKDIFPQNAVDMGLLKKGGFLYNYFRKKEIELYNISDIIGCMSQANVNYILKHNTYLIKNKVEVNPNSINLNEPLIKADKVNLRKKYEIPVDAIVFFYGGNLGIPQGLEFFCEILKANKSNEKVYFLIVGSGTHSNLIKNCIEKNNISNAKLLSHLPKQQFDQTIQVGDIGLIFLHPSFTIPNFPSRLLSYLENIMPVIACTDKVSDLGDIIEKNNAGRKIISGDLTNFQKTIMNFQLNPELINLQGKNGKQLLIKSYTTKNSFNLIHRINF